jgi:hypothetical protein
LTTDIAQELYVYVVFAVGHDVAYAEKPEVSHRHPQFLQCLAAGAFLQRLSCFQVASGRGPGAFTVGPLTLGQKHLAVSDKYHAHSYQRPGREVCHEAEYNMGQRPSSCNQYREPKGIIYWLRDQPFDPLAANGSLFSGELVGPGLEITC